VPAPPDSVALATPPAVRAEPKPEPKAAPTGPPTSSSAAPATSGDSDALDWAWPAKGKIVAGFSETANLKGIDIAGKSGQPVLASGPGKVVYAGSGLRGYGKLIIIKHNNTFLSAYAHNREILVKEGQQVARGQKIAEMGDSDADQVKLHFEIRRLGKPVDPAKFLPPA
jgi:lipoprotein NlpD